MAMRSVSAISLPIGRGDQPHAATQGDAPVSPIDRPREADAEVPDDPRAARLSALSVTLRAHGLVAEPEGDLRLRVSSPLRPGFVMVVRCSRRASDGDRLWFIGAAERPLKEADDITGAVMAIKSLTAVRM
jgi:hypothetical protein